MIFKEGEIFLPITGTNKAVEVSNMGRIKRSKKLLKQYINKDGYYQVYINELGGKRYLTHRLVADAFCDHPDPEHQTVVDHINGDKLDNRAENLRWVTVKENTQYYHDLLKENGEKVKMSTGYVLALDADRNGQLYPTTAAAAKELGVTPQMISKVMSGTKKSVKGYTFYKITHINDHVMNEESEIRTGVNHDMGFWAETFFDKFYIKIADVCPYNRNLGEEPRSTQAELKRDLEKIKQLILENLPSSENYHESIKEIKKRKVKRVIK